MLPNLLAFVLLVFASIEMSVTPGPGSEVDKALASIAGGGVNKTAAAAARTYVETQLDPIARAAEATLLEAVVTPLVFFFVIFLIFLIVCVVICGVSVGLSGGALTGIVAVFLVIGAISLAVISVTAINTAKEAVNIALSSLTDIDIEETLNSGASAYMSAISLPC